MDEDMIRAIVRDEFKKLFTPIVGTVEQPEVLPLNQAYAVLGYSSPKQVYSAIDSGLLRVGIEVEDRRSPDSEKARYYLNIPKCKQRLKQKPETR